MERRERDEAGLTGRDRAATGALWAKTVMALSRRSVPSVPRLPVVQVVRVDPDRPLHHGAIPNESM